MPGFLMDLGLTGVPAIVTGGGAVIGRATALLLWENGASCEKDVLAAASEAEAAIRVIRVLVNNAGIGERRPMLDLPLAANAIVFLASRRASFMTGSVVTVDGGFLAGKVA